MTAIAPPPNTWQDSAACQDQPPALFFPEPVDGHLDAGAYDAGRAVCAGCPVRDECLRYALDNNHTDGLWGGLSPNQRRGHTTTRVYESVCERAACRRLFTHTFPKAQFCCGTCRNAASRERGRRAA